MDSTPKRPWYRLHWLTWLVLGLVLLVLAPRQRAEFHSYLLAGTGYLWKASYCGWPLVDLNIKETVALGGTARPKVEYHWRGVPLAVNLLICSALAISTVFVTERLVRARPRMQFSIRSLLILISVVAILLTMMSNEFIHEPDISDRSRRALMYWMELKNPLRWPLLFALGCTIYSSGWLIGFAAVRGWSLISLTRF